MGSVALVRSVVGKEGDHERGTYLMKTGYRPDPTVEHPSIGAICCHELPVGATEIPRHISILPGQWPSRGGFLGGEYDAFQVGDPKDPLPGRRRRSSRAPRRAPGRATSDVVERAFARGRGDRVGATLHRETIGRARAMMSSEQLEAFDVSRGARGPAAVLRRHPLRPRLPGGPAADRGRRPLRRGDARRLGQLT